MPFKPPTPSRTLVLVSSITRPERWTTTLPNNTNSTTTTRTTPSTRTKTTNRHFLKMSSSSSSSAFPPPALAAAAEEVASLLRERKETIAVAETAAGGLVSAALLATPGASRIYRGGLTLYTLPSRVAFAGWTQDNIDKYDGPTPELVAGLASHVRKTLESDYCVGESGTAGPTASGKTPNRQPNANMVAFAIEALKLVKEYISTNADKDKGGKM